MSDNSSSKTKKILSDMQKSRDIVTEIFKFGTNQRQILYIMKYLALEIENREIMISLSEAIKKYTTSDMILLDNTAGEHKNPVKKLKKKIITH